MPLIVKAFWVRSIVVFRRKHLVKGLGPGGRDLRLFSLDPLQDKVKWTGYVADSHKSVKRNEV